jgi:LacI family transcriptional regulator
MDVANPFFSSILRGLEDVARANGQLVLAGSSDGDPDREVALVRAFIARRVDGLVIATCRTDLDYLSAEIELGTPVVFVDHRPANLESDVVHTDHRGGAIAATRHLIEHGHRLIAFLGDRADFDSSAERRAGFVTAMSEAGLTPRWVVSDVTGTDQAESKVAQLMAGRTRPTALFTAQNFVTIGAVRALHRLGLQHEVALVGFDDIEFSDVVEPKISVVPQQPRTLGRLAGERIYDRLTGGTVQAPAVIPAAVVARGSGEIPPPGTR